LDIIILKKIYHFLIIYLLQQITSLGPGDEIIISLWGENNSRENITINKDGMIYYENIGFINLSNKTLESAELL